MLSFSNQAYSKVAYAITVLTFSTGMIHSYEVGCIYPRRMPDPMEAQNTMIVAATLDQMQNKVETPIAIHSALLSALCGAGCLSYHDNNVLNPITLARPLLSVPEFGHNAYSIAMCSLACHSLSYSLQGLDTLQPLLKKWGITDMPQDFDPALLAIAEKTLDPTPEDFLAVAQVIQEADYHPYLMGQLVVGEILISHVATAGWNNLGELSYDVATGETRHCFANCMPYSDTTGYQPRNTPGRRESFLDDTKYNVTGNDKYWQPLLEDDGKGYFSRQEHVVPHIGTKARLNLNNSEAFRQAKSLEPPDYNYYEEALQVVEEMKQTADDQERQLLIETFDNKFMVRGLFQYATRQQFANQHSYQRHLLFALGLSIAEEDAVILAWKEKVKHDLVRPTTVIQRWGDDMIRTYQPMADSAQDIAARNFEAYIRVMPHAEYPSGSACLCTTYREFTDGFTEEYYGAQLDESSLNFGRSANGFHENCEGEFGENYPSMGCDGTFNLASMTELEEICGQSRLWGGMHFTKSVPDGHALCGDLGTMSLERIRTIMNDVDFGENEWLEGDSRPTCSDPIMMVNVTLETETSSGKTKWPGLLTTGLVLGHALGSFNLLV